MARRVHGQMASSPRRKLIRPSAALMRAGVSGCHWIFPPRRTLPFRTNKQGWSTTSPRCWALSPLRRASPLRSRDSFSTTTRLRSLVRHWFGSSLSQRCPMARCLLRPLWMQQRASKTNRRPLCTTKRHGPPRLRQPRRKCRKRLNHRPQVPQVKQPSRLSRWKQRRPHRHRRHHQMMTEATATTTREATPPGRLLWEL